MTVRPILAVFSLTPAASQMAQHIAWGVRPSGTSVLFCLRDDKLCDGKSFVLYKSTKLLFDSIRTKACSYLPFPSSAYSSPLSLRILSVNFLQTELLLYTAVASNISQISISLTST